MPLTGQRAFEPGSFEPGPVSGHEPLSVTELNRRVRQLLEVELPEVCVEGAVSQVKRASSGHLYFALQDASSRVDAIMWNTSARMLPFAPVEGLQVRVTGRVTIYSQTGRYQVIAARMEPAGLGAREALLRALRAKLKAEGVLDAARKRPLPFLPRCVALVTSPDGAAVHDLLKVILERFPRAHLILVPVRVQGDGAAIDIAEGIRRAGLRREVEVVVTGRGGGSVEDLWAFNEEVVARAIFASPVPVVSAVGHETDATLADEVADVRAATPSHAGQLVVPLLMELETALRTALERGRWAMARAVERPRRSLESCGPSRALAILPRRVEAARRSLDECARRLQQALVARVRGVRHAIDLGSRVLQALDPTAVLRRGFSLTWTGEGASRRLVRDSSDLAPGAVIRTTLANGPDLLSEVRKAVDRTVSSG